MVLLYKMRNNLSIQLSTCIVYCASERGKGNFQSEHKCVFMFLHRENGGLFSTGLGCFFAQWSRVAESFIDKRQGSLYNETNRVSRVLDKGRIFYNCIRV